MKAAIYLRVSTEEQRERRSIKTQRDFAERYCDLHGIVIDQFYADDGVSGALPLEMRPQAQRMLHDAKQHKFGVVLVYKLDRLGRSARVIHNAIGDLEAIGIAIRSMTEPFESETPAGKAHIGMLATFAEFERENTIQRMVDSMNRHGRQGSWLGGNVPYGYTVVKRDSDMWLAVPDEKMPGLNLSEADVVKLIFNMSAHEQLSCQKIADHLNMLGVPTAYVRRNHTTTTVGVWRPSRVRAMITNTTYKGVHQYGKRIPKSSKRPSSIIERSVPALIDIDTWEKAQQTLRKNMLFSQRNAKRHYLLRGLIKCSLCGSSYAGRYYKTVGKTYYTCTGRTHAHKLRGIHAIPCTSVGIGDDIEAVIWRDIEEFTRDPGDVLQALADRGQDQSTQIERLQAQLVRCEQVLSGKQGERDAVIHLFRRGRIDGDLLDRQFDLIDKEEGQLKAELASLRAQAHGIEAHHAMLHSAELLLMELNRRLDQPVTWELKRQLVETLVVSITVDTVERDGKNEPIINVTYRFSATPNRMDTHTSFTRSWAL